jgi:hypothetical protein
MRRESKITPSVSDGVIFEIAIGDDQNIARLDLTDIPSSLGNDNLSAFTHFDCTKYIMAFWDFDNERLLSIGIHTNIKFILTCIVSCAPGKVKKNMEVTLR